MDSLTLDFEDLLELGIHSMQKSWFSYLCEEEKLPKEVAEVETLTTKDDDDVTVFSYPDIHLYGRAPVLEKFTAMSVCSGTCITTTSHRYSKQDHLLCSSSTLTNLEIPTYSGTKMTVFTNSQTNSPTTSLVNATTSNSNSPSVSKSRKRQMVSYTNNMDNPSTYINSSYTSTDLDRNQFQSTITEMDETITNGTPSSNSNISAIATLPMPMTDMSVGVQLQEPSGGAICRTRTELIALKSGTPDLLPDSMPTVGDSPETAGSPTKPTDEPALPDEQPTQQLQPKPIIEEAIASSSLDTPVEDDTQTLITIDPSDFSVFKLKDDHPILFSEERAHIGNDVAPENVKQFVNYDPFISAPESLHDKNSPEPKRKIIKFKFSPFTVVETGANGDEEIVDLAKIKPSLTNLYIMELEEPLGTPVQPLPCGIYEIQSTKPYYSIKPDPGIYESDIIPAKRIKLEPASPPSWKPKENDFESYSAPPTPQTPTCMKRVHTDEELSLVNLFSGLYEVEDLNPSDNYNNMNDLQTVNSVSCYLQNNQGCFRELVSTPRSIPNFRTGNAASQNLLQDLQIHSSLTQFLQS